MSKRKSVHFSSSVDVEARGRRLSIDVEDVDDDVSDDEKDRPAAKAVGFTGDDHVSDSDEDIDETVREKKRAQFQRGVGNAPVEGEEESPSGAFDDDRTTPAADGFEPFNMKDERSRGWFDSVGNFVEEAKDDREAWLVDWDAKAEAKTASAAIDRADLSSGRPIKRIKVNGADDNEGDDDAVDVDPIANRQVLVDHLEPGENVLRAIRRLGKADKAAMEAVTDAADALLGAGHFDVYQDTREVLERAIGRAATSSSGGGAQVATGNVWEFKWVKSDDPDTIHGPHSSEEMDQWKSQGYFVGDHLANVRVVGAADLDWIPSDEIDSFVAF